MVFTLIDFMNVTLEELQKADHEKGPKCRCSACSRLKDLEDQWILKWGLSMVRVGSMKGMKFVQRLALTGKQINGV